MLCQLFSIFEASKSSIFKVLEPLDNACGNVVLFGFNMGRLSRRYLRCSGHDRYSALLTYKDFEKQSVTSTEELNALLNGL